MVPQISNRLTTYVVVLLVLFLGFWMRVRGALTYPFLADEYIIQSGVRDMYGVGPDKHLGTGPLTVLFGVPLRNGQKLAPLWWWLQYGVRALIPNNETVVYRILPVALGMLGIALFYRLALALFGEPIPTILAMLLSVNDVHVYMSSKSQYLEVILFVAAVLMAIALVLKPLRIRPYLLGGLGVGLALGSYLAKGVGLMLAYLAISFLQIATSGKSQSVSLRLRLLVKHWAWLGLAVLPVLIWWIGAEWFFLNNSVRVADMGYYGHLWEPFYYLTVGYGEKTPDWFTGPWYWGLLVYSHSDAWPSLTSTAVLAAVGFATALRRAFRSDGNRRRESLFITLSFAVLLGPLVWKGIDGGRYHTLYLPALLLGIGLTMEWMWGQARNMLWQRILPSTLFALTGLYTFFMFGWQRWPDQWVWPALPGGVVLGVSLLFTILYVLGPRLFLRRAAVIGMALMVTTLSLIRGPLHWGTFAYQEPGMTNTNLRAVEVLYHPVQYYPPDQMSVETKALFNDRIMLIGFDTYREESTLTFVMHYRVDQVVSTPIHVFLHIWDSESGTLSGGHDTRLLNRQGLSTDAWISGEHVSQTVVLDLSSVHAGSYTLGTGLYDYATNERLVILDKFGSPVLNNWLPLINEFELSEANP